MSKLSNRKKFSNKLISSFGNRDIASAMGKYLVSQGYDPSILDSMSAEEFDAFVNEVVPIVQNKAIDAAKKNKDTPYESMFMKGAESFPKSWPMSWNRDSFLKALGREGKKDGSTKVEKDAHIGELTDKDVMTLRQQGLDDEEIYMLADKFRKEYQDQAVKDAELEAVKEKAIADEENAKEYEDSTFGKLSNFFAPELTRTIREKISRGEDPYEDIPALAKATGIDAAIWAASLYGGNLALKGAGKLASKIPAFAKLGDKIPNALKSFAAPIGAVGFDAGIDGVAELGRQQVSDYQDGTDWGNVANVAKTSATIPGMVVGGMGVMNMVPGLGRLARPVMKQIKGNMLDNGVKEADRYVDMMDEIKVLSEKAKSGDALANEKLNERLEQAKSFFENHPESPNHPLTYGDIIEIANDNTLRKPYVTQPDMEYFDELAQVKQGVNSELEVAKSKGNKKLVKEIIDEENANAIPDDLEGMLPNRDRNASNLAEIKLDKAKKTWANTWEDLNDNASLVKFGKGVNSMVPAVAKYEVANARNSSEKSRKYSGIPIKPDANTEKAWKMGFFTRLADGSINPEYVEWLRQNPEYIK